MKQALIDRIQREPIRPAPGEAPPVEVLLYTQMPFAETRALLETLYSPTDGPVEHHRLIVLEHPPTALVGAGETSGIDGARWAQFGVQLFADGAGLPTDYVGPGMLAVHVALAGNGRSSPTGSTKTLLAAIADGTLAEFGIAPLAQRWAERASEGGARVAHGTWTLAGRPIAFVRTLEAADRSLGALFFHTNSDLAPAAALGLLPDPPPITMVEAGMALERQDAVREAVLRRAGEAFGARMIVPQRERTAKPPWLRARVPIGRGVERVRGIIDGQRLHTVCESARCPNLGECWRGGTATFMINGDVCTRSCSFCAVLTGRPRPLDPDEPRRVAEAAAQMGLSYVVVTAVNRDELPDGGAAQFAATIRALRARIPGVRVEVLIPDFRGVPEALETVFAERPDVLNHNVETVPRLYPRVRPQARYERSLDVLRRAREAGLTTKSGIMLGLGETDEEVDRTLRDLHAHGCEIVTIGQYLRPSEKHHPVVRYVWPEEFDRWRERGRAIGFRTVESGPLVRSSYHAHLSFGRHRHADG